MVRGDSCHAGTASNIWRRRPKKATITSAALSPLTSTILRPAYFRLALIVYWAALFVATHVPLRGELRHFVGHHDKAIHLVAYCGLAALCGLSAPQWGVWAVVLPSFAVVDEVLQVFVRRHASVLDWTADVVGIVLGLTLAFGLRWALVAATCTRTRVVG